MIFWVFFIPIHNFLLVASWKNIHKHMGDQIKEPRLLLIIIRKNINFTLLNPLFLFVLLSLTTLPFNIWQLLEECSISMNPMLCSHFHFFKLNLNDAWNYFCDYLTLILVIEIFKSFQHLWLFIHIKLSL